MEFSAKFVNVLILFVSLRGSNFFRWSFVDYSAESAKSEIQFKNKNSVHSVFSVHSVQKWNSVKKWNSGCLVAGAAEDHELELQANDCNWWDYAFKWVKGDKRRNYNTPSKNFKTPMMWKTPSTRVLSARQDNNGLGNSNHFQS